MSLTALNTLNHSIILRLYIKEMVSAQEHPILKTLTTLMNRDLPISEDLL
jgi:hypothetical protein